MKLLIITQVVDKKHPVLGFFHRWIEEFAKHVEVLHVICLEEGAHQLPANVHVHSLGKEAGKSRLTYVWRFYRLTISLRHEYDQVFVHMNQIYVLLGAPLWRIWGKETGLWYAHGKVSLSLRCAVTMSNLVFTSTSEGLRIETGKKRIVGQGIDTDLFTVIKRNPDDILRLITVGRIAPSKNIDTLLRAAALLRGENIPFHFKIIGVAITEKEQEYEVYVKNLASQLSLDSHVEWVGGVMHEKLPPLLQKSDIFVHDGSTNSLDKTLLEAVLCGCVVVSSNPAYKNITDSLSSGLIFPPHDYYVLAEIIKIRQDSGKILAIKESIFNKSNIKNFITDVLEEYFE